MVPRLCDSRILAPVGAGAHFTQPRYHSLARMQFFAKADRRAATNSNNNKVDDGGGP